MKQQFNILWIITISFLFINTITTAQNPPTEAQRLQALENQLNTFAKKNKTLRDEAEIDISTNLRDLVAALASNHELNITIDASINQPISTVLPKVKIQDLLLYLCKQYSLTLDFTGSIITIKKYNAPPKPRTLPPRKEPTVEFNKFNDKLSVKAVNDTLNIVLSRIAALSDKNISAEAQVRNQLVNVDVIKADFEAGLSQLAFENGLELDQEKAGYYTFTKKAANNASRNNSRKQNNSKQNNNQNVAVNFDLQPSPTNSDTIRRLSAVNQPIKDLIQQTAMKLNKEYFLFTEPTGNISIQIEDKSFEQFLGFILEGTNHTFRYEEGIYLIGEFKREGLLKTQVIQLQHRSYEDVEAVIPDDLKAGVIIKPFKELNAYVVSGSPNKVYMVEDFIAEIDKPVPNVTIELIILDVQKNKLVDIGLDAGVGAEPVTPGGSLFPGVDFTLSTQSVNSLLNVLAGQGIVNVGPVQNNFYLSLKAIEENGIVKIKSRPRLSTLNAHKATFTIGETRFYRIDNSNVQGGLNPVISNSVQFETLQADFKIEITPKVSGDEQVTLAILVDQTDFIGEIQENAPSPSVTRQFDSNIRVKNGEMIVLGGLERKQTNDTGSGVPLLARIPIIKWFFSKRTKSKQDNKLLIFIKPTVEF